MTQLLEDVMAGAAAVEVIATRYGYGHILTEDQRREIASAVMQAVDAKRDKRRKVNAGS